MKSVTLKDIAARLNVSVATVSLALNNRPTVNAETRQRVLDCIKEMEYTPHPLARGLALKKTMTIGLVCPDTENPYYGTFLKHFSKYCDQNGYSLVVSLSDNDLRREASIVKGFVEKKFDGVIVMPLDVKRNDIPTFSWLMKRGVPFVFCTSYYEGYGNDCVLTDYADGSYQLTCYLLEQGHRTLWYMVTDDLTIPVAKDRLDGYRRAYADLGIAWNPNWVIPCRPINSQSGYDITNKLLAEQPLPDGILVINDYMAFGVIRALQERGLKIPDDISVAGYDDVFYAKIASIPLTTVRQDLDAISYHCVNLLLTKIDSSFEPSQPLQQRIRPMLVVRDTTRAR